MYHISFFIQDSLYSLSVTNESPVKKVSFTEKTNKISSTGFTCNVAAKLF